MVTAVKAGQEGLAEKVTQNSDTYLAGLFGELGDFCF